MKQEFVILLASAVLCLTGRAEAQTQSQVVDVVGENQASIDATVDTIYDTDVPRSDAQVAHLRGLQLVDESVRPGADVDLLKAIGQQSLFLRGFAGYNYYVHNAILNSERIEMSGGADLRAGACQAVVSDQLARKQNNLEEQIDAPIAKNLQTINVLGLSATCLRAIGFTPIGSVTATWSNNSNTLLKPTDYQSIAEQLGVAYQHPTLGRLSLYGQYDKTVYVNRTVPTDPLRQASFDLIGAGFRFERNLGARLNGSIDISYSSLSQNTPGAQGFSGLNYGADLTAHVTGRISAMIHADRTTKPSLQLSSDFDVVNNFTGELDYLMSGHLSFSLGANHKRNEYMGLEAKSSSILTHQATTDVYASGTLGFARRFSMILDVRHENSTANIVGYDYSSMRVSLTLTGKF